jgi:hypothetical protein
MDFNLELVPSSDVVDGMAAEEERQKVERTVLLQPKDSNEGLVDGADRMSGQQPSFLSLPDKL